jgi:hypothetical protein
LNVVVVVVVGADVVVGGVVEAGVVDWMIRVKTFVALALMF